MVFGCHSFANLYSNIGVDRIVAAIVLTGVAQLLYMINKYLFQISGVWVTSNSNVHYFSS